MRRIEKCILSVLLSLLILFFARGILYSESSLISRSILVLLFGVSSFYLLKTLLLKNKRSNFYNYWLCLFLLNVVGFVFTGNFSNPFHSAMLIDIFIAMIPFFPFYYFSRKSILEERHIFLFFIIALPIIILKYYYTEFNMVLKHPSALDGFTNNIGYYFSSMLPFLFFFNKRRVLSYLMLFILMFFIVSSAKRGAILVGGIGTMFFLYYQLRSANKKERLITLILVSIVIILLFYRGYYYIQNNEYLMNRIADTVDGNSSGRDVIYKNIFNYWLNSKSIFNIVFGYGFGASLNQSLTGNFAHNDWLELLSNFGVVAVIVYALLIFSLYSYFRSYSLSLNKKIALMAILVMWVFSSIFSMVYTSQDTVFQTMILGYIIGSEDAKDVCFR